MTVFLQLLRKEWRGLWFSPMLYAAWTVFLVMTGLNMWRMLAINTVDQAVGQGNLMFGSTFFWIGVLTLITVLTMSLLAEESRSGTLEMLLTAPVTDTAVVLSKFLAAWLSLIIMILPALAYLPLAAALSVESDPVDAAAIASGMLMLATAGAAYIAFGLLVSSLTKLQSLAAGIILPALCTVFFLESLLPLIRHPWLRTAITTAATAQHVVDASRGIVDSRPLIFYVSACMWLLFAAIKVLESRHWR